MSLLLLVGTNWNWQSGLASTWKGLSVCQLFHIDHFGRRKTLLQADLVFLLGAILMATAPIPVILIMGRIYVGLGIGMASMTSPLYISEASPTKVRSAIVSTNSFLITGGQFLSYCINLAFTKVCAIFTKKHFFALFYRGKFSGYSLLSGCYF